MKYILVLFLLIFIPVGVFANNDNIKFIAEDNNLENLNFNVAQGTSQNINFVVKNESDKTKSIIINVEGQKEDSLVSNTLFFVDDLNDENSKRIQQNNNDIILFCNKDYGDTELNKWCEGKKNISLTLRPGESKRIFTIISIDDDANNHDAQIVAKIDDKVIKEINLEYVIPNKNIKSINLDEFILHKGFSFFDFNKWIESDFKEKYDTNIVVKNIGTEDVKYEYCVHVQSVWIKERVNFCNNAIINYGDTKKHNMKITVPRFGRVIVTGNINFIDSSNQIREQNSEPIEFISWPIQLIIIITGFICFCVICVLLYKYVIKNMFGRKKKKKENDKYTNSYIVKDTDNIISIAQLYGVPWKDLANVNDIDPPYILISGETIKVPEKESDVKGNEEKKEEEMISDNFENNLDIKSNKQQKNEIENITNNVSDPISKSIDMKNNQVSNNEEKKEVITKEVEEKKEKRILYASPKNMLTQSSSEPTTRAIDIDWMREDETIYTEEMQTQEKKMKTRFIILSILICVIVGLGIWWGITYFLEQNNQDNVSVDNLIEEKEEPITEEKEESKNDSIANITENTPDNTTDSVDKNSTEDSNLNIDTSTTKAVEDIKVQVLNAGSQAGAAGAVTDEFAKKGFETSTAQNAKNDYEGVVIYYNENSKESLDNISDLVSEKYGNQVHEESVDITGKYDVDFVIVLGS